MEVQGQKPDEYEKLGSYALDGLPKSLYATRYVKDGQLDSDYPIVVAGKNFGCGSSREHAPIALGSANCEIVLAESFARIFFRNCVATGELYPCEEFSLRLGNVRDHDFDVRATARSARARAVLASIDRGECWCTHECYMMTNILFSLRSYPALLAEYLRLPRGNRG